MEENCPFCGEKIHYGELDELFRYIEHLESHAFEDDEADS